MPGTVQIELNSFDIITRETRRWPGKKIRFSIAVKITLTPLNEWESAEQLDLEMTGCLAAINSKGELYWSPPMSRSGSYYANNMYISKDFDKRIKRALTESKYFEKLKEGRMATTFKATEIYPELPEKVEA